MRIAIILIFGILSYLLVFLPGYFLFLPEGDNSISEKKLKQITQEEPAKKKEKLPLKNPGDEPPPK